MTNAQNAVHSTGKVVVLVCTTIVPPDVRIEDTQPPYAWTGKEVDNVYQHKLQDQEGVQGSRQER